MKDVAVVLTRGVGAGACLSFLAIRLLQKMPFGLCPHNPVTMFPEIGLLLAVAFLASYPPGTSRDAA